VYVDLLIWFHWSYCIVTNKNNKSGIVLNCLYVGSLFQAMYLPYIGLCWTEFHLTGRVSILVCITCTGCYCLQLQCIKISTLYWRSLIVFKSRFWVIVGYAYITTAYISAWVSYHLSSIVTYINYYAVKFKTAISQRAIGRWHVSKQEKTLMRLLYYP